MAEKTLSEPARTFRFEIVPEGPDNLRLRLSGPLDTETVSRFWKPLQRRLGRLPFRLLHIEAAAVTRWDSAGIAFLQILRRQAEARLKAEVRIEGLPPEWESTWNPPAASEPKEGRPEEGDAGLIGTIGHTAIEEVTLATDAVAFVGRLTRGLGAAFRPRIFRPREFLRVFESAGVDALPIVSLISFLIGLVIAFESARPLATFGAQIFIANMIGLLMTREMGPIMTAILLAGRSGSAFAAELGTMKVNEELDALKTMGIDPVRFLVIQRVLAGIVVTPLLTIYSMFIGVLGGVLVMVALGYPLEAVYHQMDSAVRIEDILIGVIKGAVFGLLIAASGCFLGLRTREGPAAVGASATGAVVTGILLIIVADALFSVLLYLLDL
ncbi:ABC transporter permease [Methylacidimicrobium sp. B4]|uniref:ABC transporter permease n=1 Tax=Methylacidimicrobium sp. B4 TaxID=2796139 RepID=UPI001A8D7851|nr:MlaE family lipid ABC transporter permease subunit [Methylacidimicrobium sp. B4]QSR84414.1 MlaE family lipid ABC transporter permease subunit [Methylacidimicrobium sp. B4]